MIQIKIKAITNNNNNVDLFARMHSALEQNEEVHLETPSFHKDGVDLFDGLDFREDPERDVIAKQSQEIVHLLEKMTSAKEVKSRIDACVRNSFSCSRVSQFQLFTQTGTTT